MKFLADGMLGDLTRWLRLLGCEVAYDPAATDEELLKTAEESGRILLTSDLELYRRAVNRGLEAYVVDVGEKDTLKLSKLSKRFGISLTVRMESSRCPVCNSPLKRAEEGSIGAKLPQAILKRYKEFWVCTNRECGKIYWQGSHWRGINQTLKAARAYFEDA